MSQKYQRIKREYPLNPGKVIFMLACLALPAAFYLVTGHPAFIVIFLSGLGSISAYMARLRSK